MNVSRNKLIGDYWACLIGAVTMIALSLLAVMVLPIFIINEYLPTEYTKVLIIILIGIVTFCGGIITGFLSENRKWLLQSFACCSYYLVLLFVSIAFFEGVSVHTIYILATCSTACLAAVLATKKTKRLHVKRKKRRGYR